jgi:hypothetical protein
MASYFLKISLRAISAFLLLSLTACMGGGSDNGGVFSSQEAAEDQLRLIGFPPRQMYIGAQFSFEFGIAGGSGNYRVRYIQNVEGIQDPVLREKFRAELNNTDRNPVELDIQNLDVAKAAFRLNGVPELTEQALDDGEFSGGEFSYFIELTDGREVVVTKYDFSLDLNSVSVNLITSGSIGEAVESVSPTVIASSAVCSDAKKYDAGQITLPSGEKAFLLQVNFNLDTIPTQSSKIFYRTVSRYLEGLDEQSGQNIGSARPGQDYVTTEGSFEFNQSVGFCSVYVPLLDDQKFEAEETFEIEVYKVEGASLRIQDARVDAIIRDSEPEVIFEEKSEILSPGETVNVPVNISLAAFSALEIGVFSVSAVEGGLEDDVTSAPPSYYSYEPLSQSIVFNPNESVSGFAINFNDSYLPSNDWGKDLQLITSLSVSDIFDFEDTKVLFNEWPLSNLVENEIVAMQASLEVASSLAVSENGLLSVGLTQQASNKEAKIRTFYRNGKPFNVGSSFEFSFSKPGVDIELIDLEYLALSGNVEDKLLVLLKVNGLYGSSFFGDDDIVLAVLNVNENSGFQLLDLLQLGTEKADKPVGVIKGQRGEVYILAESTGQTIDGSLPEFGNRGGIDALVYKLNEGDYTKEWARFVGTNEDDEAVDIDFISGDIHVLTQSVSIQNRNQARIDFLDSDDQGAEIEDRRSLNLSFNDQHKVTTTFSGANGDSLLITSYGDQDPLNGEVSPSNSLDAYISQFELGDAGNIEVAEFSKVDSNGNDRIIKSEVLDDDEHIMLAGVTLGRLEGNNPFGGQDAFVWGIDLTESPSDAPFQVQFGTPGTDTIIDVAPVLDDKFMVLWSEDHTAGDGSLRYRVSAFAPDGRQLSPSL